MFILLCILFLIVPLVLTGINVCCMFIEKKRLRMVSEIITWILGLLFTIFLYQIVISNEWWLILMPGEMTDGGITHTFMPGLVRMESFSYTLYRCIAYGMAGAGTIGYVLLRCFRKHLHGNVIIICIAGMVIGCGLSIWWSVCLPVHPLFLWYLKLLPLNFIIFVISVIRSIVKELNKSK